MLWENRRKDKRVVQTDIAVLNAVNIELGECLSISAVSAQRHVIEVFQ